MIRTSLILLVKGYRLLLSPWLGVLLAVLIALTLTIPVGMALWFAPALVVFHNLKPAQALKDSFLACLKNMIPFTLYSLVLLVLAVIAAIPLGLGFLVLIPVAIASIYAAYRDIFFTHRSAS